MRALSFALAVCLWALALPAAAEAPLFESAAPLSITIEGPIASVTRAGPNVAIARPATLTVTSGGAAESFPVTLSPRGIARRNKIVCAFPPLLVDFDRSAHPLAGTLFQGQNRLKLVTHCRSSDRYEQYAVLEYLAYRFYNFLTPLSFRVRALEVTYQDNVSGGAPETHFGFFIEDVDDLTKRNGTVEITAATADLPVERFDPQTTTAFALFQYMIGNLDWDYRYGEVGEPCCHNAKLAVRRGTEAPVLPIPYDFDYSGLVNAPYALPPEQVRTNSVRTRFFRGRCSHNGELAGAAALFRAHRAEMNALLAGETRLTDMNRRSAQSYLDEFFDILEDPARIDQRLERRCIH